MEFIPLSQIPAQRLQVLLDDQYCTLSLRWMQTRLYMDLSVGSTTVFQGMVCQNRAKVNQSKSLDFTGTLHFFDLEGDEAPQYGSLWNGTSGRWVLVYVPDGEDIPETLEF